MAQGRLDLGDVGLHAIMSPIRSGGRRLAYAIEFVDVSKCFQLRHEGPLSFQSLFLNLIRFRLRHRRTPYWVLRGVSFAVEPGEMLGIVGVNGAGKSTVLKLVSRIIEPTSGRVMVNGRVSALLELGAGFHPDLTGRENVYLNGSILGLSRSEIRRKFDEIVQFADLESSIDIPVRYYSSGMYMRLGFSVAIYADPQILLVDEVLAVGDYAFQLKCLNRVEALKKQGVTVLFVSHDMDKIKEMCDRAIWLDGGGVRAEGNPQEVVGQYLRGFSDQDLSDLNQDKKFMRGQRWGSGEVEILDVSFLDGDGVPRTSFVTGEPFEMRLHYLAHKRVKSPVFGMAFYTSDGTWINGSNTYTSDYDIPWIEGEGVVSYRLDSLPLLEGSYLFSAVAYDFSGPMPQAYDHLDKAFVIQVRPSDKIKETLGVVYIPCRWEHRSC